VTKTKPWWWLTVASALAFAVLTVLVLRHVPDSWDVWIRDDLDPNPGYGSTQERALDAAEWLRPAVLMGLFAVLAMLASLLRRSWRPLVYAGALAAATALCELGLKWVMPRIESAGGSTGTSSFPSGHVLCAVVVPGGLLLLTVAKTRWWQWATVGLVGAVMVVLVMVAALHWATDVAGGVVLGVSLLSASALTPLRPSRQLPGRSGTPPDVARPARSRTP
jgi:membrane-associated phospholipid phosphatase